MINRTVLSFLAFGTFVWGASAPAPTPPTDSPFTPDEFMSVPYDAGTLPPVSDLTETCCTMSFPVDATVASTLAPFVGNQLGEFNAQRTGFCMIDANDRDPGIVVCSPFNQPQAIEPWLMTSYPVLPPVIVPPTTPPIQPPPAATPEPSMLLLAFAGMVAMIIGYRRQLRS